MPIGDWLLKNPERFGAVRRGRSGGCSTPDKDQACQVCGSTEANRLRMLLCDGCDEGYHLKCLSPPLTSVPAGDWFCPQCEPNQGQKPQLDQLDTDNSNKKKEVRASASASATAHRKRGLPGEPSAPPVSSGLALESAHRTRGGSGESSAPAVASASAQEGDSSQGVGLFTSLLTQITPPSHIFQAWMASCYFKC